MDPSDHKSQAAPTVSASQHRPPSTTSNPYDANTASAINPTSSHPSNSNPNTRTQQTTQQPSQQQPTQHSTQTQTQSSHQQPSSSQPQPTTTTQQQHNPAAPSNSVSNSARNANTSSSNANATSSTPKESISYSAARVIGNGSFGVVFQATVRETGETVAIKKVLQDKRYKNRELQIMRLIEHTNVCQLKHCFYSSGDKPDEVYLNLVLEYVPETVYRVSKHYSKVKTPIPALYIKLYIYQLLRALAYIHSLGICHRDIKPQNLLLDPSTQVLKLCDFGSAKVLVRDEPNISYICSRYYRAPELIFGSTDYLPAIDVWSSGCVMAELMLGYPLFPGESGVDQLVEIIKVLGTPSREEIVAMNRNYTEFKFPQIKSLPWLKVFRHRTTPDAIDLVSKMLQYSPTKRISPFEALAHPYFEELRQPTCKLGNGKPLPPLFNFTEHEYRHAGYLAKQILPEDVFDKLYNQHGEPRKQ